MIAAILNSAMLDSDTAILDSDTLLSSLRFTQKHSHSILTLTQTNSIWFKLFHFHLSWWWWPSWIWPSWIQQSLYFLSNSLTLAKVGFHHLHKKTSLIHSDSTWWLQPSWICHLGFCHLSIFCHLTKNSSHHLHKTFHSFVLTQLDWLPSWILSCWIQTLSFWIQTPCYLLSDSLKNTLTPLWLWLKLIQSDSNSFILT